MVTAETGVVEIEKVTVLAPAGTVTEVGTLAAGLLEESDTTNPPAGATPARFTVPVVITPPTTELGEMVMKCSTVPLILNALETE